MVKHLNQCSSGYINIVSFHFLFYYFILFLFFFNFFIFTFEIAQRLSPCLSTSFSEARATEININFNAWNTWKHVTTENTRCLLKDQHALSLVFNQVLNCLKKLINQTNQKQVFLIFIIIRPFLSGCAEQFYSTHTGPTSCLQYPPCQFRGPSRSHMVMKFSLN